MQPAENIHAVGRTLEFYEDLITRVRLRETDAIKEFVREVLPRLRYVASRLIFSELHDRANARQENLNLISDLVESTMCILVERADRILNSYNPSRQDLPAHLIKFAIHHMIARLRQQRMLCDVASARSITQVYSALPVNTVEKQRGMYRPAAILQGNKSMLSYSVNHLGAIGRLRASLVIQSNRLVTRHTKEMPISSQERMHA